MQSTIEYRNLPPLVEGARCFERRAILVMLRDRWQEPVTYHYQAVQRGKHDWRLRPGHESGQAFNAPGFNRLEAAADWARWDAEDRQRQYDNIRAGVPA